MKATQRAWPAHAVRLRGLPLEGNWAPVAIWTGIGRLPADYPDLTVDGFLWGNLVPVTIGNIIGGAVMVGIVYWFVYLRGRRTGSSRARNT